MNPKLKSKLLRAGTIITWGSHNIFKKIYYKIKGKPLYNNKFVIIDEDIEFLVDSDSLDKYTIYIPQIKLNPKHIQFIKFFKINSWNALYHAINFFKGNQDCITCGCGAKNDCGIESSRIYVKLKNNDLDEYIY